MRGFSVAILCMFVWIAGVWTGWGLSNTTIPSLILSPDLPTPPCPPMTLGPKLKPITKYSQSLIPVSFQNVMIPADVEIEATQTLVEMKEHYDSAPPNSKVDILKLYSEFPSVTVFILRCADQVCDTSKKYVLFTLNKPDAKQEPTNVSVYWRGPAYLFHIITETHREKTYRLETTPAIPLILNGDQNYRMYMFPYNSQDVLRLFYPTQKRA
ncbi:hypothetical protein KW791_02095 [Candidatus Parcubacteria bacterium]|nr:hypothetical protein [Candidatus Parcubacteria bacterium]